MLRNFTITTPPVEPEPLRPMNCRHCGEALVYRYSILPHQQRRHFGGPSG